MNKAMADQVFLVTGGTDGIGKATALELAALGATVVIGGRNAQKSGRVVEEIRIATGNARVEALLADLSSLSQVGSIAESFISRHDRLDVLINNAAVVTRERILSEDGFEMMLAVNYLAPFLLTNLLLEQLKTSVPARIVNVSSMGYKKGRIHFDDLNLEHDFDHRRAYYQTRLAMVLFTFALARRLEGTGVTANCLHPGIVRTTLSHAYMGNPVFRFFEQLIAVTPLKGAQTSIFLATSPGVAGISGEYFRNRRIRPVLEIARNQGLQEHLWDVSAKLTGLS